MHEQLLLLAAALGIAHVEDGAQGERPVVAAIGIGKDRRLQRDHVAGFPAELVGQHAAHHRAARIGVEGASLRRIDHVFRVEIEIALANGEVGEEVACILVDAAEPGAAGHLAHPRHGRDFAFQAGRQHLRDRKLRCHDQAIGAIQPAAGIEHHPHRIQQPEQQERGHHRHQRQRGPRPAAHQRRPHEREIFHEGFRSPGTRRSCTRRSRFITGPPSPRFPPGRPCPGGSCAARPRPRAGRA